MDIDFKKLQQDSLRVFLESNPKIKNDKFMSSQLDINSKLICTILSQYHQQLKQTHSQDVEK
ncbi:hypothetical protein UT300018_15650 [Clostridium faecium]